MDTGKCETHRLLDLDSRTTTYIVLWDLPIVTHILVREDENCNWNCAFDGVCGGCAGESYCRATNASNGSEAEADAEAEG